MFKSPIWRELPITIKNNRKILEFKTNKNTWKKDKLEDSNYEQDGSFFFWDFIWEMGGSEYFSYSAESTWINERHESKDVRRASISIWFLRKITWS